MTDKQHQWLINRLDYLRGLKSPSEQQRLLLLLGDKATRMPQESKTLALLINAERSAINAQEARTKVTNLIQAEKRAAAKERRKARDHALYQSAGLLIMAALVDS